jgi:hypothetical protein
MDLALEKAQEGVLSTAWYVVKEDDPGLGFKAISEARLLFSIESDM